MQSKKCVLLFLDFDGVLHHWWPREDRTDEQNRHFAYLPRLEAVLRDYPSTLIVISSDWRMGRELEQLRAFFSEDLQARVIGTTEPIRPPENTHAPRQHQIEKYLRENQLERVSWIALDDDMTNFSADAPLVLCRDEFSDEEEQQLRTMLARLMAQACLDEEADGGNASVTLGAHDRLA